MSNYVILGSTAAELIGAAQKIRDEGVRFTGVMNTAIGTINTLDVPGTFPPDEFTNSFLNGDGEGGYHFPVPSGVGDQTLPANEAVKTNAGKLGEAMTNLGDRALDAMWAYTATDDENATDIDNAART